MLAGCVGDLLLCQGGVALQGEGSLSGGLCQEDTPLYGKERVVRFLLECILVVRIIESSTCSLIN